MPLYTSRLSTGDMTPYMKALSPAMLRAIEAFKLGSGVLRRYTSGYWWAENEWPNGRCFTDRTIQAIVDRGLAEYTKMSSDTYGRQVGFPIEVTLTEKANRLMTSCEKCWADAHIDPRADPDAYSRLVKERDAKGETCTPEQQAGPQAKKCKKCGRVAVHQYSLVCMACGA